MIQQRQTIAPLYTFLGSSGGGSGTIVIGGGEGPPGPAGPEGPQGPIGSQGAQGQSGDASDPGPAGPQGAQGNIGPPGQDGINGVGGTQGPQGEPGTPGTPGPQGYQGENGTPGTQGPQGYQGEPGTHGPQGYQGTQGAQGKPGSAAKLNCKKITIDQNYTVVKDDFYIGVNSVNPITITLPTEFECELVIKVEMGPPIGNRKITIKPQNNQRIDGEDSLVLEIPYQYVTLIHNRDNWFTTSG